MEPLKGPSSVTIPSADVCPNPSLSIVPSTNPLSTPELESSPQLGSEWSYGSVRRSKRPPPVIIPGYPTTSGAPSPSLRNFSITSASTDGELDDPDEDQREIPIYFGGLPEHLSARRPSTGIPLDANSDQYGFPCSSRSSSFGNVMDYSPLPKTPVYVHSTLSPLRHAQIERSPELVRVDGFHRPVDPFPAIAPSYRKPPHPLNTSTLAHVDGLGLSVPKSTTVKNDLASISLGSGLGRSIRTPASASLSVPSSLAAYNFPQNTKPPSRIRTDSQSSTFTISAYADISSATPPQRCISRLATRIDTNDPPRSARLHFHPNEPISPRTVLPTPQSTPDKASSSPTPSSAPSSAHAEAGFFLSQMDSYLAQHADTLRLGYSKEASRAVYQEGHNSSRPSLVVDTSNLGADQACSSAIERTTRSRGHLRNVSTGSCLARPGSSSGRIDPDTTIQLSIDQESFRIVQPVFKYARTRGPKAFQGRNDGRPHTAGSIRDVKKNAFSETGCIEFRMEKKELWPYHYSILESLPTLRRIEVNGDRRYNYLKRNASLALRSNGVYEVIGKEEKGEVAWKFEYVVEDRRSETTGKVISGERIIMPLTFSCAPAFLDRARAVRSGLVKQVRQNVIPTVNSHKVPPPSARAASTDSSPAKSGLRIPLFSFMRPDTPRKGALASQRGSEELLTPSPSKTSLLPWGNKPKRPSTGQGTSASSSPLSPLSTTVSVSSLSPEILSHKLSYTRTFDSGTSMGGGTSFMTLEEEHTPLLSGQRSAGLMTRWVPKSILKKRPSTAVGHHCD